MAQRSPAYRRILLKLSGEALLGNQHYGIDPAVIRRVATEITEVVGLGVQVGVVIGGGNIFRGAGLAEAGMDRVTADQMGMLATVINALAMQDALERQGTGVRVMSALQPASTRIPTYRNEPALMNPANATPNDTRKTEGAIHESPLQ